MRWTDFIPFAPLNWRIATYFIPFWVFIALALAIHEAAHAVVGAALGMKPKRVAVGVGPARWCWRTTIRGVPVTVGPYLFFGLADFGDLERTAPPLRRIPMILAGPAANLAAGAAILTAAHGLVALSWLWHALVHGPQIVAQAVVTGITHPVLTGTDSADALTPIEFINFCGLLSFSIGIINLIPFWPLDGGNVVIAVADILGLGTTTVRCALVVIGIAGTGVVILPTLLGFAVQWRSMVGSLTLAMLVGLAGRQWMWYSHRRWGTTPPPTFRQIIGLEPYLDERGLGDEGRTASE